MGSGNGGISYLVAITSHVVSETRISAQHGEMGWNGKLGKKSENVQNSCCGKEEGKLITLRPCRAEVRAC